MARHSDHRRNAVAVAEIVRESGVDLKAEVIEYEERFVVNVEGCGVDAPEVVYDLQGEIDRRGLPVWVEPINSALIGVYDR